MDERTWVMTGIAAIFSVGCAAIGTLFGVVMKSYWALIKRVAILDNTVKARESVIADLRVENATLRAQQCITRGCGDRSTEEAMP